VSFGSNERYVCFPRRSDSMHEIEQSRFPPTSTSIGEFPSLRYLSIRPRIMTTRCVPHILLVAATLYLHSQRRYRSSSPETGNGEQHDETGSKSWTRCGSVRIGSHPRDLNPQVTSAWRALCKTRLPA